MAARLTRAKPEKALQASRPEIRHEVAKILRSGERKANALTVEIRIPSQKEVPIVDRRMPAKPAKDLRIVRLDRKGLNPLSERRLRSSSRPPPGQEGGTLRSALFFWSTLVFLFRDLARSQKVRKNLPSAQAYRPKAEPGKVVGEQGGIASPRISGKEPDD
jgi:hypothetical protein